MLPLKHLLPVSSAARPNTFELPHAAVLTHKIHIERVLITSVAFPIFWLLPYATLTRAPCSHIVDPQRSGSHFVAIDPDVVTSSRGVLASATIDATSARLLGKEPILPANRTDLLTKRAVAYLFTNELQLANADLADASALAPLNTSILFYVAITQFRQADYESAKRTLERCLVAEPTSARHLALLTIVCLELQEFKEVEQQAAKLLQAARKGPLELLAIATFQATKENVDSAIDTANEAIQIEPISALGEWPYVLRASLLHKAGKNHQGMLDCYRALSIVPDSYGALRWLAKFQVEEADLTGLHLTALRLIRLKLDDAKEEGYYYLSHALLHTRHKSLLLVTDHACAQFPDSKILRIMHAYALLENEKGRESLSLIEASLTLFPNDSSLMMCKVMVLAMAKDDSVRDTTLASKILDQIDPSTPGQQRYRQVLKAICLADKGEFEKAVELLRKMSSLDKSTTNRSETSELIAIFSSSRKYRIPRNR